MSRRAYPTEAFTQQAQQQQPAYGNPYGAQPVGGMQPAAAQPQMYAVQPPAMQAPPQQAASPMYAPVVPTGLASPATVPAMGAPPAQFTPASTTVAPKLAPVMAPLESGPGPVASPFAPTPAQPQSRLPAQAAPRHEPPPMANGPPAPGPQPVGQMAGAPPPAQMQQQAPAPTVGKRPVAYSSGTAPSNQYGAHSSSTGYGNSYGSQGYGSQAYGSQGPSSPSVGGGAAMGARPAPQPEWDCGDVHCRMTVKSMPRSDSVTDQAGLPFGCTFHPLAKTNKPVPLVNFGSMKIVRCDNCRAYINPYVHFVEGGKRWRCNLCYVLNEVPREYFSIVGADGKRYDHKERVELNTSVVDFVASPEFMQRPPMPPTYFFVIDVSYTAIASGMVKAACAAIHKAIEDSLAKNDRTRVGFVTVDSTVHYYNLRSSLSTPQMLVVPDVTDNFCPLPEDLLVNLKDSRHVVDALLTDLLPNVFVKGQDDRSALGPALHGAYETLSRGGGKILVFQSTLPTVGVGKLANRATPGTVAPEKEKLLFRPGENFYKNMALECYKKQIGCDMFLFTPKYVDVASLSPLPRYTGGEVNHYLLSQNSPFEANRLQNDVYRALTREAGHEAVLRIRLSKGLTLSSHHGSFFLRGQDLVSLPTTDTDKAYTFRLKIGDTKSFANTRNLCSDGKNYACIQGGLLYTTTGGERRIRVVTKCCPITDQVADLYRDADLEACMNLITKLAITKALEEGVPRAQAALKESCVDTLAKYMRAFPSGSAGQMMLPSTIAKLPLYTLAVCKSVLFRSDPSVDVRVAEMLRFNTLPVRMTTLFFYPNMYNLAAMPENAGLPNESGSIVMPPTLELSCERVDRRGVFLLDNGIYFQLWVGSMVAPQFLQEVFGLQSLAQVDPSNAQLALIRRDTPLSQRVCNVVDSLRATRTGYQWLYPIKEKDPMERAFFLHLVHDRFQDNPAFREYATELQKLVNQRKG